MIKNPLLEGRKKKLKSFVHEDTLEGGSEGQGQGREAPSAVSSAASSQGASATLAIALDALVVMFRGWLLQDRESLDAGFEDLVGVLEEWRDGVPKA